MVCQKMQCGDEVDCYRQLSRFKNHPRYPRYYVSSMIFEELNKLREEYNRLSSFLSTVFNAAVAWAYFGQNKVSRIITVFASTSIKLHREVMEALGTIINSKHPDSLDFPSNERPRASSMAKEIPRNGDCRVFRDFLNLHSLYNCYPFMRSKSNCDIEGQINTQYRIRMYFSLMGVDMFDTKAFSCSTNLLFLL